jgi:hypothetical protein
LKILLPILLLVIGAIFLLYQLMAEEKTYYYAIEKDGAAIQVAEKDSTGRPYLIVDLIDNYYRDVDNKNLDNIRICLSPNMDQYYAYGKMTNDEVVDLYIEYNDKLYWSVNNVIWETMDMSELDDGFFEIKFSMDYEILDKKNRHKKFLEDLVILVDENNQFKSIYSLNTKKIPTN